jgi:hypothetical protein
VRYAGLHVQNVTRNDGGQQTFCIITPRRLQLNIYASRHRIRPHNIIDCGGNYTQTTVQWAGRFVHSFVLEHLTVSKARNIINQPCNKLCESDERRTDSSANRRSSVVGVTRPPLSNHQKALHAVTAAKHGFARKE